MQWQRIIDGRPDLLAFQVSLEVISALGADRVLIEDRFILRIDRGYADAVDATQRLRVIARIFAPFGAPSGEMRQLGAQHSRLQRVEAAIVAHFVMKVLLRTAVNAQPAQTSR